jgi:hypothetical protein
MEQLGFLPFIIGGSLIVVGWLWLLIAAFKQSTGWGVAVLLLPPAGLIFFLMHFRKAITPVAIQLLGVGLIAFPVVYEMLRPIDKGPRERVVITDASPGEVHLVLTGAENRDYASLKDRTDIVVLKMANDDVTDATLANLKGMVKLRELDLNGTQVTDAGLAIVKELPALQSLSIARTKVTEAGFREHLWDKATLMNLDARGLKIPQDVFAEWRAKIPGRRGLR